MKKISFFALLLSVLFVAGCTLNSTKTSTDEVYTGTQGIVMSFIAQNPPSEIFEGSPMSVLIDYSNKGASEIKSGKLYLTGYDSTYLFGSSSKVENLNGLNGKSLLNPVGEEKIAEFVSGSVNKPDDIDRFSQKLKLTACYEYETHASAQVCIDPDPFGIREGKKTCTVSAITLSGGQGAPVGVTSIDERIAGNRIQFKIFFKNLGSGEVYNVGKGTDNCFSSLDYSDLDQVTVVGARFSRKTLSCEPSKVRLVNNEGYVICYGNIETTGDEYLTTLNVDLKYNYRDSIIRSVDILDVPGGPSSSTGSSSSSSGDTDCASKGCCVSDKGGNCKDPCNSNTCSGGTCIAGYCSGGTSRVCCVGGGSSSETQTCGELCGKYNGHSTGDDWCRCLGTGGSCPAGFISRGTSSDGCSPCCAKA